MVGIASELFIAQGGIAGVGSDAMSTSPEAYIA